MVCQNLRCPDGLVQLQVEYITELSGSFPEMPRVPDMGVYRRIRAFNEVFLDRIDKIS
jgi:hypothetical protein